MKLVSREDFGQVFVTDTHPERLEKLFENISSACKLFEMEAGSITSTKILNQSS